MSNDPDLIPHLAPHLCPECEGDGGWLEGCDDDEGSVYVDCSWCGGSGEVSA